MGLFDGVIDSYTIDKYGTKARLCRVSENLITGRNTDGGIRPLDILKKSKSASEFDDFAREECAKDRNTDFYHFSLLMGQYFGVYNVYCYMYVSQDVRNRLAKAQPNPEETIAFFEEHNFELYQYIYETYGIDYNQYLGITSKMCTIDNNYSNYNNPVVRDIGKVLMGNSLYKSANPSNSEFIGCGDAIDYFNTCNQNVNKNIK